MHIETNTYGSLKKYTVGGKKRRKNMRFKMKEMTACSRQQEDIWIHLTKEDHDHLK